MNAPLHVTEQLALEQRLGHRRAVDRDERARLAPAALVQRARDELLAGAALAGDQHGRVGLGDAVDQVADLPHRRARADDLARQRAAVDLLAQPLDLGAQRAVLHRALERERELLDLERLGDEVVGAGADRRDRGLDAAERGDHDDRHVGPVGGDALAQLEAVHAAHVEVGDDDVEVLVLEQRQRFVGRRLPRRLEAGAAQRGFQRLAQTLIVVDDEDATLHNSNDFRTVNYTLRSNVVPAGGVLATTRTSVREREDVLTMGHALSSA